MTERGVPIRARYCAALGILLLLGVLQVVLLVRMLGDQQRVGLTVNLAGRQRMLSQRLPTLARDLVLTENFFVRAERRKTLRATALEMRNRHEQLTTGDPAIGPRAWPPADVQELYFSPPISLDAQVREFTDRALHLAAAPESAMVVDNPDVNYLIARRDAVLLGEDRVVSAYVNDGEQRQAIVTRAIYALFGLEVVVIGLILAFLFVPMERQIIAQRRALQRENESLQTVVAGSQALAETLAIESLVARFVEGAERLLGVPIQLVPATADITLPVPERALVDASLASRRLAQSPDGSTVALALDGVADEPGMAIIARGLSTSRRSDLVALEVFATNLHLAAHNASLYRNVRELDRLKSDLIAMLAHDFRGPLTSIIGYAELMREGFMQGKELEEAVNYIVNSAWRLSSLAADTLTMSQLERNDLALTARAIDVVGLARDAAATADTTGRVVFRSDAPAIEVLADARRLRQAFDNLIGNALKYSPGGEPVEVTVTHVGNRVRIAVADHGIGIPAGELDRVFERFSRASNARSSGINGTGFGLYLSKLIVEKHGGAIEVRSTEGAGSTFTISLPASAVHEVST